MVSGSCGAEEVVVLGGAWEVVGSTLLVVAVVVEFVAEVWELAVLDAPDDFLLSVLESATGNSVLVVLETGVDVLLLSRKFLDIAGPSVTFSCKVCGRYLKYASVFILFFYLT